MPAKAGIQYPQHRRWVLDRPPEPVIGPAKGRTRWRAMTVAWRSDAGTNGAHVEVE